MFQEFFHKGIFFSSEFLMLATFLCSTLFLLLSFRFAGACGVIAYSVIALVAANIQVLKTSVCLWFPEPVALGTIIFSSLYLCSDMLTEYYGAAKARQAVWIQFATQLLFVGWMLLTLAHPMEQTPCQLTIQRAMETLFLPTPALVAASLIAYLCSQYNDIWIFSMLKQLTQGKHLWLRTSLSNLLSGFVDHVIFSLLAWVVFAATPMSYGTLWWSYILGAYTVRAIILLLHTPLMYLAKWAAPVPSRIQSGGL